MWSLNHEEVLNFCFSPLNSLFLMVIAYQAQADDEEWTIDQFEQLSLCQSKSGEVTHGDSIEFFYFNRKQLYKSL